MQNIHRSKPIKKQKGVSLFIVIVLVMLSMLLALWASRTSLFNQMIVGNDADYQRAFEAAQALIQDAEFDIQGTRPDGSYCSRSIANVTIDTCRPVGTSPVWFPTENKELADINYFLKNDPLTVQNCYQGICQKNIGNQNFWDDTATYTAMRTVGARYGQFTGAQKGSNSNPILNNTGANRGGWYWIELMPYDPNAGNSSLITNGSTNLPLNLKPSIVYRITAVAVGLKTSTKVVLQSTFAQPTVKN